MTNHSLYIICLLPCKKSLSCVNWKLKLFSWKCAIFRFRLLMKLNMRNNQLNMRNNQKMNIDWKLCFICHQQRKGKLCSTPQVINSLSSNLFGFWRLGVLDITCSSVISTLHDEAEEYLIEKEAKYHKVCANI